MCCANDLYIVFLIDSKLTGPIPQSIGQLTELTQLYLDRNFLTGTLPTSMAALTRLFALTLHDNELNAMLPNSIGSWSNLVFVSCISRFFFCFAISFSFPMPEELMLAHCSLAWCFTPHSFYCCFSCLQFSVANNDFSGTLPEAIGQWTDLTEFDVKENSFTGTIPDAVLDWSNIRSALFSGNLFNGTMPFCSNFDVNGTLLFPKESNDELSADCAEVECDCCTSPQCF